MQSFGPHLLASDEWVLSLWVWLFSGSYKWNLTRCHVLSLVSFMSAVHLRLIHAVCYQQLCSFVLLTSMVCMGITRVCPHIS